MLNHKYQTIYKKPAYHYQCDPAIGYILAKLYCSCSAHCVYVLAEGTRLSVESYKEKSYDSLAFEERETKKHVFLVLPHIHQ